MAHDNLGSDYNARRARRGLPPVDLTGGNPGGYDMGLTANDPRPPWQMQYDMPSGYNIPPGQEDFNFGPYPNRSNIESPRLGGIGGDQYRPEAPMMYDDAASADQQYWDQIGEAGGTHDPETGYVSMPGDKKPWFNMEQAGAWGEIAGGVGKLGAGIASLFGGDQKKTIAAYDALVEAYENIDDPQIIKKLFDAPWFKQIAQYEPELVRDFQESLDDYETYGEGDAGLRAKEDEALERISERARRGDPLTQRLQTQQAQSGVGRALGRANLAAQAAGARRGQVGAFAPGAQQGAADYASRVGAQNTLAARGDMAGAERAAFAGAGGIRQTREAAKERALNVRNNYRNAMSNRSLQIQMSNQKARQSASNQNVFDTQKRYEGNLTRADTRRGENRNFLNRLEGERYTRDVQMEGLQGKARIEAARLRDEDSAGFMGNLGNLISSGTKMAGQAAGGLGWLPELGQEGGQ